MDSSPNEPTSRSDRVNDSLYVRYKESTKRIKDALESIVPAEIFATDVVDAFMDATDYMVEHKIPAERSLLKDLKLSIRVRRKIAVDKYGGGDDGHAYFIVVLEYCWSHLRLLEAKPKAALKSTAEADPESDVTSLHNRFEELLSSDEDSDSDEEEDTTPTRRPVDTGPKRLTFQELLSGSAMMDIHVFLWSLDLMMETNAMLYQKLRECHFDLVPRMMEASVVVNFAIEQVASMEQVFIRDYPHLNTLYRMMARRNFSPLIEALTAIVMETSPLAGQFTEKIAVAFLGDILESSFRHAADPYNMAADLLENFCTQWQLPDGASTTAVYESGLSVEQVFLLLFKVSKEEIGTENDEVYKHYLEPLCGPNGPDIPAWLSFEFIGEDRSIINTIYLIQRLSPQIQKLDGELFVPAEELDSLFNRKNPATQIKRDMDQVFRYGVMPSLVGLCHKGLLSRQLPYQDELLTGFVQIKDFVKHPERPVSWAMAFTMHSILTCLFEFQKADHLNSLAEMAQTTFERFFTQLERVEKEPSRLSIWQSRFEVVKSFRNLVRDGIRRTRVETVISLWNPYCAGVFLTYLAYYGNLGLGTPIVDAVGQLQTTLNLFNALQQVHAIRPGQATALERVLEDFKGHRAILESPLPVPGEFYSRWRVACGVRGATVVVEVLSKSFRRICRRDFNGVRSTLKVRKCVRALQKHGARVCDMVDAMVNDASLWGTNLLCLACYLNQFCISMFRAFGWTLQVEAMVKEKPMLAKGRINLTKTGVTKR